MKHSIDSLDTTYLKFIVPKLKKNMKLAKEHAQNIEEFQQINSETSFGFISITGLNFKYQVYRKYPLTGSTVITQGTCYVNLSVFLTPCNLSGSGSGG